MLKTPLEGVECGREFLTIRLGCRLQRLFSTFPDKWPGFGLLLLRVGVGVTLIYLGAASLMNGTPEPTSLAQNLIAAVAGVCLICGIWTPVSGGLATLDQIWITLSSQVSPPGGAGIHLFLAVLSASVAMLGPGAWSIDARLFGRRRVYSDHRGRRPYP